LSSIVSLFFWKISLFSGRKNREKADVTGLQAVPTDEFVSPATIRAVMLSEEEWGAARIIETPG
jgi:hypothetical protein